MTILLSTHLLAIGIWIGVVGAEFVIEFAGMKDTAALKRASILHFQTDIWVEIPAFAIVLVTGMLMLNQSHLDGLFLIKIIAAIIAVLLNLLNVYAVFRRRRFALIDDIEGMQSVARMIRFSGLIIPFFLVAFGIGVWSLVSG